MDTANALAVSINGPVTVSNATPSTTKTTGALTVSGGVGVAGNVYATRLYTDDFLVHDGDLDTKIGFPAADTFTVTTSNAERVRVDSTGNVGIGTNNPITKLDVWGNQGIRYPTADSRGYVELKFNNNGPNQGSGAGLILASDESSNFNPRAIIDTWTSGVSGAPPLVFRTRGTERMRLTDDGNFGIGTASPAAKLQLTVGVNADATWYDMLKMEADGNWNIRFAQYHASGQFLSYALRTRWSATDYDSLVFKAGNVGVRETNPIHTLDVAGSIGQNGKELYAQKRWEVDLTAQANTNFYPILLKHLNLTPLGGIHPVHFKVFGASLISADSYNENTLIGYARGQGYSDHPPMYDVHYRRYDASESRFLGIYQGTSSFDFGVVIYMRGGYRYSILTDSTEVVTHTTAVAIGNSTFALKNSTYGDVSGTSANIDRLIDIIGCTDVEHRFMSGVLTVPGNVGIGTVTPLAKLHIPFSGSYADNTLLIGDLATTYGDNLYSIKWGGSGLLGMGVHSASKGTFGKQGICFHIPHTEEFSIKTTGWTNLFAVDGTTQKVYMVGNVGIGTVSPEYKLDVNGTARVTNIIQTTPIIYKAYLATGLNVNAATTYTEYNIFGTGYVESINNGLFTLSGTTKIVAPSTGYYRVTFNICFLGSGGQRTNIGVKPIVEGTLLNEYSGSDYIRYADGHDEATTSMTTIIQLTGNRQIGLTFARLTNITNSVTIDTGSFIILEKL